MIKNSKLRTAVGNINSEGVSGRRGGQTHPGGLQGEQGLWKPRELVFSLFLKKGSNQKCQKWQRCLIRTEQCPHPLDWK